MTDPVLVEVVRSGFVESVHRGSYVVLDPDGAVREAVGEVTKPTSPRSATKPLQAVGMLRAGLGLDGADLALVCASHSGEPDHVERVLALLEAAGLTENDLACPPAYPLDETASHQATGIRRATMNCSGKHTGMLTTCVRAGWDTAGYVHPEHLLQRVIHTTVTELTGEPIAATAVDGCGAPMFAYSLTGLARAFGRLVQAGSGPKRRVADAMRAHPWLVAGTGRTDTVLMTAVDGLLAKGGAEAVQAFALPDGTSVAIKIADGGSRAVAPVTVAVLRKLGIDAPDLDALNGVVLGGGKRVGEIRAVEPR